MKSLGKALLGAITFCASRHKNEECGINGLPLTPNSIRILGCFQKLVTLNHPHLSLYLDLVRGKHERVFVVFEHYEKSLSSHTKMNLNIDDIIKLTYEILLALDYLEKRGMVHGCLTPKYVLIDDKGKAVLSNHGLYYMTEFGSSVKFPIGHPKYMSPEVLFSKEVSKKCESKLRSNPYEENSLKENVMIRSSKSDIWSLAIIVLELICGKDLWPELGVDEMVSKVTDFVIHKDRHPFDVLLDDLDCQQIFQDKTEGLEHILRRCLNVVPSQRPSITELLAEDIFGGFEKQINYAEHHKMFPTELRSNNLRHPRDDDPTEDGDIDLLSERGMDEVYYLWKLTGGEVEGTFKKLGRLSRRPPIMNLPCFVSADGETFGSVYDSSTLFDDTVTVLPQHQLRQRLKDLDEKSYYLLLEFNDFSTVDKTNSPSSSKGNHDLKEAMKLPLIIRESDVEYQFHRIILLKRLLEGYPFNRPQILKECRVDIPPLYRAQLWASILEIEGDVVGRYEAIDKKSPTTTDRQIEVDIPRCHQYNPLLSSPIGHHKFKRILKAWVTSHPEYVYWQGLDSLCAPFLYLNFNDEATAFACLCAFIPKYLHNFFLKDNAQVIQEYLAVFSHLIAFHDPLLFSHLDSIGFIPDLYSIPWFLTMYAHVFPLHKIFHLWDTLMLGDSSFPLCIGVAILKQLRDQLLMYSFNECILLFSDMPEIDMEKCVRDSIQIFQSTPKSVTFRYHAGKTTPQKFLPRPPLASLYSKDYYNSPKTHLSIDRISLDELRSEKCARISAEDLIDLMGLHSSCMSPSRKNKQNSKPVIAVLDVRSSTEFQAGFIPQSVNASHADAFTPDGNLTSAEVLNFLLQHKNAVKVVLGDSSSKEDLKCAEKLIQLGYSKVCILHKGVDVIKTEGLLVSVVTP